MPHEYGSVYSSLEQIRFFPEQAMFNHECGVVMSQVLHSASQTLFSKFPFENRIRDWSAFDKLLYESWRNEAEEDIFASPEEGFRILEVFKSFKFGIVELVQFSFRVQLYR